MYLSPIYEHKRNYVISAIVTLTCVDVVIIKAKWLYELSRLVGWLNDTYAGVNMPCVEKSIYYVETESIND